MILKGQNINFRRHKYLKITGGEIRCLFEAMNQSMAIGKAKTDERSWKISLFWNKGAGLVRSEGYWPCL